VIFTKNLSNLKFLLLMMLAASLAWGQQSSGATAAQEADQFQNAENRWMTKPVDVQAQIDQVSPSDRVARDQYWDAVIGASGPLSSPLSQPKGMPLSDSFRPKPEFGDLGDGVWLVGKFESYRVFLSASQRSVYTEIDLRVQHIFGHPTAPSLAEGKVIHLERPGGTILAPWGGTLSYDVRPEEFELQPGHIYLLALGYHSEGNFYTDGYSLAKRWDVTGGKVKPGSRLQAHRANSAKSEINGLALGDAIRLLDKRFEEYYGKEHE
jgi:hypothetical protein